MECFETFIFVTLTHVLQCLNCRVVNAVHVGIGNQCSGNILADFSSFYWVNLIVLRKCPWFNIGGAGRQLNWRKHTFDTEYHQSTFSLAEWTKQETV